MRNISLLRSETQIQTDLRIITFVLWMAHRGRKASLIHLTKEIASLLLDHKLTRNTFLTRRYTIHGVEAGIRPNAIFRNFIPLGKTLAYYGRSFGLFMMLKKANHTTIIPLVDSPPDVSELVTNSKAFAEEAIFLGSLGFVEKNILATHRNIDMTRDSHRTVAKLFLRCNNALLELLDSEKPESRIALVKTLVDGMNESADELVKKSTFYPSQATVVRNTLLKSKSTIAESLAKCIHPHEQFSNETASVSKVILRGSHLVRSLLRYKGLYPHTSTPVHIQTDRFVEVCKSAELDIHKMIRNISCTKAILCFLRDTLNSQLIWWT